jgi:hypothetical protein
MKITDIAEEGFLKVSFPKKYVAVLKAFRERGFPIYDEGDFYSVLSPTSYAISSTQAGLSPSEFLEFYKALKVLNGFKKLEEENRIIHLRPKRPLKLSFKVSAPERRLIEFAARQHLLDVSDYIRMCVMDNAIEAFITASRQKETGLV